MCSLLVSVSSIELIDFDLPVGQSGEDDAGGGDDEEEEEDDGRVNHDDRNDCYDYDDWDWVDDENGDDRYDYDHESDENETGDGGEEKQWR